MKRGLALGVVCIAVATIAADATPAKKASSTDPEQLPLPKLTEKEREELASMEEGLPAVAQRKVDFAKDILPIFSNRCDHCHGPEDRQGGLRLDIRAEARRGGDNGLVIKVGKSAASDLIHRVAGLDEDLVMPPDDEALGKEQVSLLRAWIDQGAVWPDAYSGSEGKTLTTHWAFNAPDDPKIPTKVGAHGERIRNPIDNFILSRLSKEGIAPSPEADRPTLIRRLSLDLLGLLPKPEEVDAFVDDQRPDAYERLVERLLASPHFGERWGRHWLDLARYADSDGYEKDNARPWAWRYREWVINAINSDLPYDQFTVEQIAGDLLPDPTLDQKVATGFHRNTLTNREGGIDREEDRVKNTVDRANTTGTVWMGLTVGCAQCHSHKYDPITQREYYGFYAFFNSMDEKDIAAPLSSETQAYQQALAAWQPKHQQAVARVKEFERELPARQAAWESKTQSEGGLKGWDLLDPTGALSSGGATLTKLDDGSMLASGPRPKVDEYTLVARMPGKRITALRVEVLPDDKLPAKGPGRADHGNLVLSELKLSTAPSSDPLKASKVEFSAASASHEQAKYFAKHAIDGKNNTGWAIADPKKNFHRPHTLTAVVKKPMEVDGGLVTLRLKQFYPDHSIGRFRVFVTETDPNEIPSLASDQVIAAFETPAKERSAEQAKVLAAYYRTVDPEMVKRTKALAAVTNAKPKAPPTKAQSLVERAKPRTTNVHVRGDFLRKGDEVIPHTPASLPPLSPRASQPDRLDLAQWIANPDNPLTARVAVNRVWKHLFGRGLVRTVEDFGTQGDDPSHPELLDWLAQRYPELDWSRKRLIKLIVTSATYRQSSKYRPELRDVDPQNVLLSRQNRFRVEAEVVRDLFLSASGLLHDKVGGPSVYPPLPPSVIKLAYAGSGRWPTSKGKDKYRRGMYIFVKRTVPFPMLNTFDAPEASETCTRRERSNTPLQALTLLNDESLLECARALGERIAKADKKTIDEEVAFAFRLTLGREPTAEEATTMKDFFKSVKEMAAADPKESAQFAGDPDASEHEAPDAAARVALARVLLNLDEFLTRE
ncbi:Planctomycete cytochrome C [Planctomycetes bacterium Pan216]|uniref:Planctomycete cytochrome C n=1 Tax=Kolteria novifilia TaxID=2527975 RepID=A0A518B543_9BACT|nr:Planctomycete cytochrome C [Planctomycetes bacterium Pan216]